MAACEVGFWSGTPGAPTCTACTENAITTATGSTLITECLCTAGHEGDIVDAASTCDPCGLATYKGEVGPCPPQCTACPGAGVTTAETGSTLVTECLCIAGWSGDIVDTESECAICPVGEYNEEVGPGACTRCPEFATTEETGSTAITDCLCEAGFTGDIAIPTDLCGACELGSYKPEVGPAACAACPVDATTAETGSSAVTDCLCTAGFTGEIDRPASLCFACPVGTYKAEVGPGDCTACTEHADTATTGSTEIGARSKTLLSWDLRSHVLPLKAFRVCVLDRTGSCRCIEGHGRDGPIVAPEDSCDPCPVDFYKPQPGNVRPHPPPPPPPTIPAAPNNNTSRATSAPTCRSPPPTDHPNNIRHSPPPAARPESGSTAHTITHTHTALRARGGSLRLHG